jgi:hypothetical protein
MEETTIIEESIESTPETSGSRRGRSLQEPDIVKLFNCCLDLKESYDNRRSWWLDVETRLTRLISRRYSWKSCKLMVENKVRRRDAELAIEVTDEGDAAKSTLTTLIDEWRDFLSTYQATQNREKAAKVKGKLDQDAATLYQEGLLHTIKSAPIPAGNNSSLRKRSAPRDTGDIGDAGDAGDITGLEDTETSSSLDRRNNTNTRSKKLSKNDVLAMVMLLAKLVQDEAKDEREVTRLAGEIEAIKSRVSDINSKLDRLIGLSENRS